MHQPLKCTNCGAPTPANLCSKCLTMLNMANELALKNGEQPKFLNVGIFEYYAEQSRELKNQINIRSKQ